MIFALKKFQVYLLSTQIFLLITDHQSREYASKDRYIQVRLARWMHFLAEYDFGVMYRAGGKNGAADFLSRLRAALLCDENGEKENYGGRLPATGSNGVVHVVRWTWELYKYVSGPMYNSESS